jgi:hypothetical protein
MAIDDATNNLTRRTLAVWRPRTSDPLSEEDARKIVESVSGFFTVLLEWEAREEDEQKIESSDPFLREVSLRT